MTLQVDTKKKDIFYYSLAVAINIFLVIYFLKLWKADLHIPFSYYNGDGMLYSSLVKSIMDNGWYLNNKNIGMPFGTNLYDFPMSDNLHFIILKLLLLIFKDYGIAINLYYLSFFPLTTIITIMVLRKFNIKFPIAIFSGLIYSFLPYRFIRGEMHLFLSAYYIIPLTIMLVIWIYIDDNFFIIKEGNKLKLDTKKKSFKIAIVTILLTATAGVYYAFFGCFLILLAGVSKYIKSKEKYFLIKALAIVTIILAFMVINLLPNILYYFKYGKSIEVAQRIFIEAEIYGMKITKLLIPISGHGINILDKIINQYSSAPLSSIPSEDSEYLGIIGVIGFIFLLFRIMKKNSSENNGDLLNALSELNIYSIILATIGGLGSIFALIISPQIRAYNRISVYIAFFSIFAVAILLENFHSKFINDKKKLISFYLGLIIAGSVTLCDQYIKESIPKYNYLTTIYNNDKEFVNKIENSVPTNSMIYQLPYFPFPENGPINRMGDYQLFRGYLHSKTLKWSYGAMKGRESDLWQREIAKLPIEKFIETISLAGFNGIYIDNNGYTDKEKNELEKELSDILQVNPMKDSSEQLMFFNMLEYNNKFKNKYSEEQLISMKVKALHPLIFQWQGGFSNLEGEDEANWRWCSDKGQLVINNTSVKERKISIKMTIFTGYEALSNFKIDSKLISYDDIINLKGKEISKTITIPPGKHIIKFISDAQKVNAPNDPRDLVFRICNFKYEEIE